MPREKKQIRTNGYLFSRIGTVKYSDIIDATISASLRLGVEGAANSKTYTKAVGDGSLAMLRKNCLLSSLTARCSGLINLPETMRQLLWRTHRIPYRRMKSRP